MRITGNLDKFIILLATVWFLILCWIEFKIVNFIFITTESNERLAAFLICAVPNTLIFLLLYKLWIFLAEYYGSLVKEIKIQQTIKTPLPHKYKKILKEQFAYYNRLDVHSQLRFEKKVYHFILSKNFVPTLGIKEPTIEMKVLIAASAAQVTLGFPDVYLINFKHIVLHASDYLNPFSRQKHQGEVNPKGSIVLSWNNFVQGYAIPTNAINLGIHEMAHALKLENFIKNKEYLFIDAKYFHYWDKVAKPIFYKIQKGEDTFLRAYAGSNSEEFFAVCVEYFFEKPHELHKEYPELYNSMERILRQDPKKYIPIPDHNATIT